MVKSLTALACIMLCTSAWAQSIRGTVRDGNNKELLTGATVQLENNNRFSVTNEQGVFVFENIARGPHTLVVKFMGYETLRKEIEINQSDIRVDIELTEGYLLTDEMIIRSTRADDQSPTTFKNIDKRTLEKQNFGQDLPFVLNWTPSLVTTSDAGAGIGYTGVRIRGSDAIRINVTINGIPYNDSESQGTFWVNLPDITSSTQSIQVQRGVGTSTNGGSAFGASINLQTTSKNESPYADITNSFGSFNTRRHTISMGSGLLNNHWVIDGRLSKIVSDGFIDRASSDLESFYFSTGYHDEKTIVKAVAFGGKERTYQSWYGVPESRLRNNTDAMMTTAMNEGWNEEQVANLLNSNNRTFNPYLYNNQVDNYNQQHYQLHWSQQIAETLTGNTSLHYTKGRGYFEEFRYADEFKNYGLSPVVIGDSTIESSDIIRRRWLDNDFYGITYSLNYDTRNYSAVLGGAWNRYVGDHFGEIIWAQATNVPHEYQYYFNKGDKHDFTIYFKNTFTLTPQLSAFTDVQYRGLSYKANGFDNKQLPVFIDAEYHFFNPKLGMTYTISPYSQAYVSFAVAKREPVRDDFVDNPGRTPRHETLHNVEAGYRMNREKLTLNINYYLMNYRNQLVLTGALNDVGAAIRTNVDKSYRTGVETEATWRITKKLTWSANLTLSQNKIKKFMEVIYDYGNNFDEFNEVKTKYFDSDISFSPSVIAGSIASFAPFANAEIAWLTKHVGRQFLDNTSTANRSIDGYWVNDLRFSYSWRPSFLKELSISLLINNIFNEEYESNGFTYGYRGGGQDFRENFYYPQAGKNFLAMIGLKL
jgi:iron complex outermembrane receptor protein